MGIDDNIETDKRRGKKTGYICLVEITECQMCNLGASYPVRCYYPLLCTSLALHLDYYPSVYNIIFADRRQYALRLTRVADDGNITNSPGTRSCYKITVTSRPRQEGEKLHRCAKGRSSILDETRIMMLLF